MEFRPETALGYARAIARPRLVGTAEESAVAQEIAGHLEQLGYRVERQPFEFSTAPTAFISLEILAGLVLILATFELRALAPWAPAWPAALLALVILLAGPINRAVAAGSVAPASGPPSPWSALCLRIGSRYRTANLVATLPDLPDDPTLSHLYLVAHYDSKSQPIPLNVRVALFVFATAGGLAFAGLTLLEIALPVTRPVATVAGIVALAAGLPLLMLRTGNASPGAIDNASGVGLLLYLAERLAQCVEWRERLRVTILFTSAEEMTLMGAQAFVRENEQALRRLAQAGGVHILNLDSIGVKGALHLAGGRGPLAGRIRQACDELGISLERFGLIGAMFDHMPFAQHGFDAVSLLAIDKATRAIHTPSDTADKLDVRGFEQTGQLVWKVIAGMGVKVQA